jgi:hypothetical protein
MGCFLLFCIRKVTRHFFLRVQCNCGEKLYGEAIHSERSKLVNTESVSFTRHEQRNGFVPGATVNLKIAVQSEDATLLMQFTESHQGGISQ